MYYREGWASIFVVPTPGQALTQIPHLILTTTLCKNNDYYPHVTDKEPEAQEGSWTYPRSGDPYVTAAGSAGLPTLALRQGQR